MPGSPFGPLVSAICPAEPPPEVTASLLPAEREFADALAPSRRREWLGGRFCLVSALARLTSKRAPILAMASGAPIVPDGTSGSISHKGPLIAALATGNGARVGIDIESVGERDGMLDGKVLTVGERARLRGTDATTAARIVVTHFSIKEAVYKTLEPVQQEGLEFEDVELTISGALTPRTWIRGAARVRDALLVSVAFIFDGDWVMATALLA